MTTILLIVHVLIAVALVITVLLQRSEGGALGIGGNPAGGLMTSRGAGNLLTRTTAILAAVFMVTSIVLAIIAGAGSSSRSLFDNPPPPEPVQQQEQQQPAAPTQPSVPLSR
jgi:preprotein translocase subunit SecG